MEKDIEVVFSCVKTLPWITQNEEQPAKSFG